MPRLGIWTPMSDPARKCVGSGWPLSAPVEWQPVQSMMPTRYLPRSTGDSARAVAAERTTAVSIVSVSRNWNFFFDIIPFIVFSFAPGRATSFRRRSTAGDPRIAVTGIIAETRFCGISRRRIVVSNVSGARGRSAALPCRGDLLLPLDDIRLQLLADRGIERGLLVGLQQLFPDGVGPARPVEGAGLAPGLEV